jgi:hypothetical protein
MFVHLLRAGGDDASFRIAGSQDFVVGIHDLTLVVTVGLANFNPFAKIVVEDVQIDLEFESLWLHFDNSTINGDVADEDVWKTLSGLLKLLFNGLWEGSLRELAQTVTRDALHELLKVRLHCTNSLNYSSSNSLNYIKQIISNVM